MEALNGKGQSCVSAFEGFCPVNDEDRNFLLDACGCDYKLSLSLLCDVVCMCRCWLEKFV